MTGEYIRLTRGMNFHVLMGRDTLIYAALCYGAAGSICATGNVDPRVPVEIYEAFIAGDHKRALDAQYRLAPLRIAFGLGTFPVVVKEALNMIGIDAGPAILPDRSHDAGKPGEAAQGHFRTWACSRNDARSHDGGQKMR